MTATTYATTNEAPITIALRAAGVTRSEAQWFMRAIRLQQSVTRVYRGVLVSGYTDDTAVIPFPVVTIEPA